MKMKKIYILILSAFFLGACEDVIEMDLNNVEPKIVIEAKLYNQILPASVIITETTDFFGELEIKLISNANVTISDDLGNSVALLESENGFYSADFFGDTGRVYTLDVIVGEEKYSGSAKMLTPLIMDSVNYEYSIPDFPFQEEGFQVTSFITNSIETSDYGMFTMYKNNDKINSFYLYDDTFTNGHQTDYLFYNHHFEQNDTVVVQLSTCDKGVYDYLYTLSNIVGETFRDTGTPYNPNTNLDNGALGYFGVFSVDVKYLILK